MTDSTSGQTWGTFTPVMPSFIRLVAGLIVLVVVQAVILGFPGISDTIQGTQITTAAIVVFIIGIMVAFIVMKFGTQFSEALADAYKSVKSWITMLSFLFQIIAIAIVYYAVNGLAAPYFRTAAYAVPLIFLLIALVPTIKLVVSVEKALAPHSGTRHSSSQN